MIINEFDYGAHSKEVIESVIADCKLDIKNKQSRIKDFTRILERPRGYKKAKLEALANSITSLFRIISMLEIEISECQAELKLREFKQQVEMSKNIFIDAINEAFGYEYISDREEALKEIVSTKDEILDFKKNQNHYETRKTSKGVIEVFILKGSKELSVMDFGDYRLTLID
jgi:hypothetical protein|tara:strand:+ start:232 stop:747 length:516 start_codon:yes stop_codon:yes gene_type:complete